MSEKNSVTIRNLSKMYKLYSSRRDRMLDLFNLKFALRKNFYQEFWALRDINLEIPRGGKIGIIGRNGAGKSTLLKIICGNIDPTVGDVRVNGRVSALLELGTGFHPEFSGRENIFASLAYMGVAGKEAQKKYGDIVDFSELEEFIDNPIKTYSAGMYARLAFSVATAITPEILIIDEVLGAGDAYFAMKCVDKMLALTSGGSTVLFVSHDLASVQRLCDRAIWIERGRLLMEGDTLSVTKSYAASVREQEEVRLRARNLGLSRQTVKQMQGEEATSLLFHFVSESGDTFRGRHPLRRIVFHVQDEKVDEIKVGDAMDNDVSHPSHILSAPGYMEWGEPATIDGAYARVVEDRAGIYKHAPFVFPKPAWLAEARKGAIEIEYKDVSDEKLYLEYYDGEKYNRCGYLENAGDGKWKKAVIDISVVIGEGSDSIQAGLGQVAPENGTGATDEPGNGAASGISDMPGFGNRQNDVAGKPEAFADSVQKGVAEDSEIEDKTRLSNVHGDVYGTGEMTITKVQFLDKNNREKYVYTSGEAMKIRICYSAGKLTAHPVFVAAIYRIDGVVVHQAISSMDGFDFGLIDGSGRVDIIYDPLLIGQGEYVTSVAIFHHVDPLSMMECPSYSLHDRKYHFKVLRPGECRVDLGIINHPVGWLHESGVTAKRRRDL